MAFIQIKLENVQRDLIVMAQPKNLNAVCVMFGCRSVGRLWRKQKLEHLIIVSGTQFKFYFPNLYMDPKHDRN